MFNQYSKHGFNELNAKLKKSLNFNLNLLAQNSKTKNLFYIKKYEEDDFLFEQGEKVDGIYFITKGKVIEALLIISNPYGKSTKEGIEITYCIQRKEIAAIASTTYETVIRELKKLKLEGAISVENQKIVIKDKEYLINSLKKHCGSNEENKENDSCSYLDLLY